MKINRRVFIKGAASLVAAVPAMAYAEDVITLKLSH